MRCIGMFPRSELPRAAQLEMTGSGLPGAAASGAIGRPGSAASLSLLAGECITYAGALGALSLDLSGSLIGRSRICPRRVGSSR